MCLGRGSTCSRRRGRWIVRKAASRDKIHAPCRHCARRWETTGHDRSVKTGSLESQAKQPLTNCARTRRHHCRALAAPRAPVRGNAAAVSHRPHLCAVPAHAGGCRWKRRACWCYGRGRWRVVVRHTGGDTGQRLRGHRTACLPRRARILYRA